MPELASASLAEKSISVAPVTLSRFLIACGFIFKKTLPESEQDRPDLIQAQAEWKEGRQPNMREHRGRLIFIDKTSTDTKMTKAKGRSLKGERLFAKAPLWPLGDFKSKGLVVPWVINAPMNRVIFDIYVETQLAPILKPGDVVILDNLASHKSKRAENIVLALASLPAAPQP
jgi:hypothetical protein